MLDWPKSIRKCLSIPVFSIMSTARLQREMTFRPSDLRSEQSDMLRQQVLIKEELLTEVTQLQEEVALLRQQNEDLRDSEIEAIESRNELKMRLEELSKLIKERDIYKEAKVKGDEWAAQVNIKLKKQQDLLDNYTSLLEKQQQRLKLKEESNQKLLFELKSAGELRSQLKKHCDAMENEVITLRGNVKTLESEVTRLQEEKSALEGKLQDSVPIAHYTDMQTRVLELEGLVSTSDSLNPSIRKGRSYSALSFTAPLISPGSDVGTERLLALLRARNAEEGCEKVSMLVHKVQHLERYRRLYERLRAGMGRSEEHISTQHVLHWYLEVATESAHYRARYQQTSACLQQLKTLLGVTRSADIIPAVRRLV